ncbi:hypothetical protein [Actinoallomurus soli]|uniref:hypothetical protein n=1 Tax=Actinoallomurus soli TaxID=2952535 RepID=UPI0020920868|nr:hypothetical protein [Actinoallomurus soli]MCO5969281.1 hypothetical protein [Actinoallomurus soli]
MKLRTLVTGTAGTAALAMGALVTAPPALAVSPATATVQINCEGGWPSGQARLDVQQNGTTATITFTTSVVWTSHSIPANSMNTTLTMSNAHGGTVTFKGTSNPAWTLPWQPFNSGPLTGTVAPGDVLQAKSLTSTVGTLAINCTATSPQAPGPFVF